MNVSLTKELENFVGELVSSGMYYSASEVVRDGLRLLKEQQEIKRIRTEELRVDILRGFEQSLRGESRPLDVESIKAEGERRLKKETINNGSNSFYTSGGRRFAADLDLFSGECRSDTADRILLEVKKKMPVAQFPEMGSSRHEYLVNLRSFPFKQYVIFYLPLPDGIEVLRMIHGSRDVKQIFDEMIPLEP